MIKLKKYKKTDTTSFALGASIVYELLTRRPDLALGIYVHPDFKKGQIYQTILKLATQHQISLAETTKPFDSLSVKDNCLVIAEFSKFESVLDESGLQIVLVNPSNTGNLGTIIRTLVGFGTPNLAIIKPAVDLFDPKVVRASMGSLFQLNFGYFNTFAEYRSTRPERKLFPLMTQASQDIKQAKIGSQASLIFGTESAGLDQSYLQVGQSLIIPHTGQIDSLNLPIAVGIAVYEATRTKF